MSHIVRLPKIFQLVLYDAGCSLEDVKYIIENVKMVQPLFGVFSEFSWELLCTVREHFRLLVPNRSTRRSVLSSSGRCCGELMV